MELAVMGLVVTAGALWNRWLAPQILPDLGKAKWVPFYRFMGSLLALGGVIVTIIGVLSIALR